MTLEQLCRLRTIADSVLFPKPSGPICDLSRDEAKAILAAIDGMPNPRLVEALEAVLLFYHAGEWTPELRLQWGDLTEHADCTTKGLCDFIRKRLAEPFGENVALVVKQT